MKDEPEAKEEPKAKEGPKTKDEPVTPSNSAGQNKRTRSSKADPEELPAKWPTQPQVVGSVTLEGEAMSKDKASKLKCNVSLKCILASDGSYIFKSDGDKGEFGDEDEEEDDDCKIEIPDLNGDGNEGDAPNNRQNSKSDSKMEPDDEEDIDEEEEEHPKKKSHKDKRKIAL